MTFDTVYLKEKIHLFYCILFLLIWSSTLYAFLWGALLRVPIIGGSREEFILIVYSILIFACLPIFFKLNIMWICAYICIVIAYHSCFSLFPENIEYLQNEQFSFCVQSLLLLFLGASFENNEKMMKILCIVAVMSILCTIFYNIVLGKTGLNSAFSENMVASYNLLPNVLVVLAYALYKKKTLLIIPFLIGFFVLIGFGTRGPIVACLFFFVLLCGYYMLKGYFKIPIAVSAVALFLYIAIFQYSDLLIIFLEKIGLSTRVFRQFLFAEKVESAGRDVVYDKVWNGIDFIQMHGFAGDRFLLGGAYSHNLFLEMWYSFGVFGGSLILLFIFTIIIAALYYSETRDSYFLLVLISYVFVQLLFSGSFLQCGWLYFLIGYSINIIVKNRRKNNQYNYGGVCFK